jgi:hypothetical protein
MPVPVAPSRQGAPAGRLDRFEPSQDTALRDRPPTLCAAYMKSR